VHLRSGEEERRPNPNEPEAFTYLRARTLAGEGNLSSDDVVAVRRYFEDLGQRPNGCFVAPE
jgi:hypothetical protein